MKLITAIVRPDKLDELIGALVDDIAAEDPAGCRRPR